MRVLMKLAQAALLAENIFKKSRAIGAQMCYFYRTMYPLVRKTLMGQQGHYRLPLKAQDKETTASSEELENALQRIDEREAEVKRLHSLLDMERRIRTDHTRRGFKAWLKKQPAASIGELGQKIQADASLPALSSRAGYAARLRAQNYTQDALHELDEL
jgi:hypothetical protein